MKYIKDMKTLTLKDWLPHGFETATVDARIHSHLEDEVVEEISGSFSGSNRPWPGTHKNVNVWCRLATGYAVGWNESPKVGWAFIIKKEPK